MSNKQQLWFSFDNGRTFERHDTAEEARKAAEKNLQSYGELAGEGWSEETESICWGRIHSSVRESRRVEKPDGWDEWDDAKKEKWCETNRFDFFQSSVFELFDTFLDYDLVDYLPDERSLFRKKMDFAEKQKDEAFAVVDSLLDALRTVGRAIGSARIVEQSLKEIVPRPCPHCGVDPTVGANSFNDSIRGISSRHHEVKCSVREDLLRIGKVCPEDPSVKGRNFFEAVLRWNQYVFTVNAEREALESGEVSKESD